MEYKSENRICQNCKKDFTIEPEDFGFYEKIKVPPPTFCPGCRYFRRAIWRKTRKLFKGHDARTGKEIFTGLPPDSGIPIYELSYWLSDAWDPMSYGREYDFSAPFFVQFNELMRAVPFPSMDKQRCVNSDYSNMCDDMKNAYLCFNGTFVEDSAYCVGATKLKNCFDLNTAVEDELCYDSVRIDKSYQVYGSVMLENCVDAFFSKNCTGCSHIFGCVNQRNVSYSIFNVSYSKEEYFEKIKEFKLDTWSGFISAREQAEKFWLKFPVKYMLGFRNYDVRGEDIKDCKNVKDSWVVRKGENLKFVQDSSYGNLTNSYDFTSWGLNATLMYETLVCGEDIANFKFCFSSYPNSSDLEYCINMRRCQNCFACDGLKDKQYCIFNKQYSKEEFFSLVEKIKQHMNEMPYVDSRGNLYKYGEFFPAELSPYAYNEVVLYDIFPLSKSEAEKMGFKWRDPSSKEYETTLSYTDIPESISQVTDQILEEVIKCSNCTKAYRLIPSELAFLRNASLPVPRTCVDCRFVRRQQFIAPPVFKEMECMCGGDASSNLAYKNTKIHPLHGAEKCSQKFTTAYNPTNDIIYCEECYKQEVY